MLHTKSNNGVFYKVYFPKKHHKRRYRGVCISMKATGIVRRIDDLGRVVIPKEIRRTLRIREGDTLEIFVEREGEVIIKKYSPIIELSHFAEEYADELYDSIQFPDFICDRDEDIALSSDSRKDYLHMNIGTDIEDAIENREHKLEEEQAQIDIIRGRDEELNVYVISVIIANCDPIGAVVIAAREKETLTKAEDKVAESAAGFLGKQME